MSLILVFTCGLLYEVTSTFWLFSSEQLRPLRAGLWSMLQAIVMLTGVSPQYLQEIKKERVEAGLRFVAKLKRHKLGDLVHRIRLVTAWKEPNGYSETWRLDLTSSYTTEWWQFLKPKVEAREDAARVVRWAMPALYRRGNIN